MSAPETLQQEAQDPSTPLARLRELMSLTTALDQHLAKNPSISPQLIEQLLQRRQPGVSSALASNPNTPLSLLFHLGALHSEELLKNPSLELFFIEDPGLLQRFPERALCAFALAEQAPRWLQHLLAKHPNASARLHLLKRSALNADIAALLAQSKESFIRAEVAARRDAPAEVLAQLADDPAQAVRQKLLWNESTPCEALCRLLRNHPGQLRSLRNIAKHPNIQRALLLIVEGEKAEVLRGNPSFLHQLPNDALSAVLTFFETPDWILRSLSTHPNEFARRQVGAHPNTPTETLTRLAQDTSEHTRQGVAKNPRTPSAVLLKLSRDSVARIRAAVAENPRTTAKVLGALAIDPQATVRGQAGRNPNLYIEMIEYLSRDRDDLVRELVAQNPKALEALLQRLCHDASAPVAKAASQELSRRRRR